MENKQEGNKQKGVNLKKLAPVNVIGDYETKLSSNELTKTG